MSNSPKIQSPVTLRQIAKALGISVAAVSMALRNGKQVSTELKQKVKEVAKQMGWKPNPLLAAYQAQVRALKPVRFRATLGWLNDHADQHYWCAPWDRPLLEGATQRAHELGFLIDTIWIPDRSEIDVEANAKKYQKILHARGINGLILPNLCQGYHSVLPWKDFSVVCVGQHQLDVEKSMPLVAPDAEHHLVTFDAYENTLLAIRKLREAGCRRIGLALSTYQELSTAGICSAAFLRAASEWPKKEQVPILYNEHAPQVVPWINKYSLDAVICMHGEMKRNIELAGRKMPGEVRLAHLNLAADVVDWSGVDRSLNQIGAAAIDLLSTHVIRNEHGIPSCPKKVLIRGTWVDGNT